jgi:hypothetical protein
MLAMSTTTAKQPAAARERAWTVDRRGSTVQFRRRSPGESRSCSWGAVVDHGSVERHGLEVVGRVVREREHLLDTDVAVRVVEREIVRPQVRDLLHARKPPYLLGRRAKRDCSTRIVTRRVPARRTRAEQANGRDPARPRGASPLRHRIDHNVGELAEPAVGAVDAAANLESHLTPLVPYTLRSAAAGRLPSTARSLPQRPRAACRWRLAR